jgi:two-component system chemotaxis response regulator CheY
MAKILIVDDSAFARNRLRMIFENGGHEVLACAENGEQALEMFKGLHPELVTLDYLMLGLNGEEVLKEILRLDQDAKVIMISGSGDATIEERVLQVGAMGFIEKFIPDKDYLKVIDQVMSA